MRRMLDPKEAGGSLPSTITFDQEGNRTVGKNLGVDGKLKLKSLVSASNPDGDITKELGGGGNLYEYTIVFLDRDNLGINRTAKFYSSVDTKTNLTTRYSQDLYEKLLPSGSKFEAILDVFGSVKMAEGGNTTYYSLLKMTFTGSNITLTYFDPAKGQVNHPHNFRNDTTSKWNVIRNIASPRKAN